MRIIPRRKLHDLSHNDTKSTQIRTKEFLLLLSSFVCLVCLGVFVVEDAWAQTSQAVLQGRVLGGNGMPVNRALVLVRNLATNTQAYRYTNEQGLYYFSAVSPGSYSVRVDALGNRPEERSPVELAVAARLELDFALTASAAAPSPAAVPGPAGPGARARPTPANVLSVMYGADAAVPQALIITLPIPITETLVSSLSSLIDETRILELPLSGRDVYTLLVLQPGVTSDGATARGLGFSVSGQRVASSNFLLDGVDNNDPTITGRATKVSAEAVKEYRMTTSNWTAEYGRASGFLANAITRSGTNNFHGTLFSYFNHDRLNANSFANNLSGLERLPSRSTQTGASVGGPVWRDRLFFFGNFERAHRATESRPFTVFVPTPLFVSSLPQGSVAAEVMRRFPPPDGDPLPADHPYAPYAVSRQVIQPSLVRDTLGLARLDYSSLDGRDRFTARYSISQATSENFSFSVYPGLNAPLVIRGQNLAFNYTRELGGGSNELKFGYGRNTVRALRPQPDVPFLSSGDGVSLPGSGTPFDYSFQDSNVHILDNFSRLAGRHALVLGAELRVARHNSYTDPARAGFYDFTSIFDFFFDAPSLLQISLNRQTAAFPTEADFRRQYLQKDFGIFFQDNIQLTPRLTLNLGVRYENFGVPNARAGSRDLNFVLGGGATPGQRITAGGLAEGTLYGTDRNNIAPRFGFALDLFGDRTTVVRGAYGLFYDRVFNSIWLDARNNNLALQTLINLPGRAPQFEFSIPASEGVFPVSRLLPAATVLVDDALRTPYSQSWFVGVQRELTPNLIVEVTQTGSLGRKLVTADLLNRALSIPPERPANNNGRYNPGFSDISYRANQGLSNFLALEVSLNRRFSSGVQFQMSYTYSRTRDMQSDPLVQPGLSAQRTASSNLASDAFFQIKTGFTRQFDPRADYGRSDFDQTHNLVFSSVAQSPRFNGWLRFLSDWQAAALVGIRSGFPFSVHTGNSCPAADTPVAQCQSTFFPESGGFLVRNRADFLGGSNDEAFLDSRPEISGGVRLLDQTKFRPPVGGDIGNQPRNVFRGPGFWNVDFGLSRSFPLPYLGEQGRIQFRADLFNLFNHTNLNSPNRVFESPAFGQATFGRQGFGSTEISAAPLDEQPRRVQFALKAIF